jgi:hypothetical protein
MDLMQKIKSPVSNGSLITFAGLTHFELLMQSDKTIPPILEFLGVEA